MTLIDTAPIEDLAAALDEATQQIAGLDPTSRRVITDSLDALNALHKSGLTTIVRRLKDDPRGKELLFDLVDDPGVRMILSMHGIIRPDATTLARQVLDGVRPGLQSHGGDVEFDSIRDGVAYVRLTGACNGCSMAAVTMREGVEQALVAGVPGVVGVEVLPNDPTPTLIPLSSIGVGRPSDTPVVALGDGAGAPPQEPERAHASVSKTSSTTGFPSTTADHSGWSRVFASGEVPVGELRAATVQPTDGRDVDIIVVNAAGALAAYVNACAHQGLPLDNALIDADEGTLTCPWHGFCYDSATGECMSMPGAQLEQLPLRIDDGQIWVRAVGV